MKQDLIDFLGDYAEAYCCRIKEVRDGIYVYGSCNMFSSCALSMIIEFAQRRDYRYYVDSYRDEVRFRIYRED